MVQLQREKRLRFYMEDALVMLRPVQHQVVMKTLPGLAQSFGAILDALELPQIVATVCGDDVCLIICEDNQSAIECFDKLKEFAPPFFFSKWYIVKHSATKKSWKIQLSFVSINIF